MRQFLVLRDFTPLPLNAHTRGKVRAGIRLRKRDKELICFEVRRQQLSPADGRVRVDLFVVVSPGQRRPDEDSLWKSLLDALVKSRVLVNDSPRWCQVGDVRWFRGGSRATVVALSTIEDAPDIAPVDEIGLHLPEEVCGMIFKKEPRQ